MKDSKNGLKIVLGLLVSLGFLYLAFRQLDFGQMKQAFAQANYWLLLPTLLILFLSHWLRSVRWQILLKPVQRIPSPTLFSALLVGYAVNDILPAHLGELIRAYLIGRKRQIAASSVLATIVVERIIDVLTLVFLMALTLVIYPFPGWVKKSGYLMFGFALAIVVFLVLMKLYTDATMKFLRRLVKPFPHRIADKIEQLSRSFLDGLKPMVSRWDYAHLIILSLLIWTCYWGVLYLNFYTFNLIGNYQLDAVAGLVLLVITTISVVVPSSPGYVGTYHWLCQVSLELFHVPRAVGLTYAIVVHAINFFPVFLVGLLLAWKEGIKLSQHIERM
ncbi:MAG: flippase-like domain-containing protein [candidate division KSB1 bacterium]|nr:flippase-like domain-containing protein [candidate division KSB1 bacterium]MDZ7342848.1 flippase-like domain-containing protein [candidate division KSB1 bacterium]